MIPVSSSMVSGKHRRQLWPITPENKAWAERRMAELGISKAGLARRIGTSRAMLSLLFNEDQALPIRSSRLWPDIVSELGGDPPGHHDPAALAPPDQISKDPASIDDDTRTILENWSRLTQQERQAVSALVKALTSARK